MRIQETDRILKESRYARHSTEQEHEQEPEQGLMAKAWRAVSSLPGRITGLFRKH